MKFTAIYRYLLVATACLLATTCTPPTQTITIITTNDIHGSIESFPRLATLVEQYRDTERGKVLLIDAGDRWTGNPYVDLAPNRGEPIIEMMDSLGYDLATFGNHEFDFGLQNLADRNASATFPFIAANIDANGTVLPQPAASHIFEINGIKIAMLGLITTARGGYPDGAVENFGNLIFSHPIETALRHRTLRDSADVFIALSHIGYELDSVMATQMPELDVILGAHSHTFIPDTRRVDSTVVTQAASSLQYVTVTTLYLTKKRLTSVESHVVKLDTVAPDARYQAMVDRFKSQPELGRTVGRTTGNLTEDGLMNMINDILRVEAGTDFAIYNRGGMRIDSLPAGDIALADIYAMEPFGNTIYVLQLTLDQIKQMILNKYNSSGSDARNLDIYPSGFTYTIVLDPDDQDKASDVKFVMKGRKSPTGVYSVATCSYLQGAYDFPGAGTGEDTGVVITDAMIARLQKSCPWQSDNAPRGTIK